jgi:phosphoglycolate phosphatase-like HAD superfamily hydrolase
MYVLILDFDGVILNLNINWNVVLAEVSRTVGFKVDSMLVFWKDYFGTKLFDVANDIAERYELEVAANLTPYDDAKPALESFKGTVYLASMQSEKVINFFLDKHDLKKYFREILGRSRFGSKARQLQYIMAKERTSEKVVLIDDSKRNIEICNTLGLSWILLDRKGGGNLLDAIKSISGSIDHVFSRKAE